MHIQLTHPLITCICITANRAEFLLKSIISFDSQGYPNRELVISFPSTDSETKELLQKILAVSELRLICIERDPECSLGTARNEAVAVANGEYICIWDDDDWYHQNRLIFQYNNMLSVRQKRKASILKKILLYDQINGLAYSSLYYNWAGSLLCDKQILQQHPFADSEVAEDLELINYLTSSKYLHQIEDHPYLYIFLYHGKNVLHYYHFCYFTRFSDLLNKEDTEWVKNICTTYANLLFV